MTLSSERTQPCQEYCLQIMLVSEGKTDIIMLRRVFFHPIVQLAIFSQLLDGMKIFVIVYKCKGKPMLFG